jgi:amidase
VFGVPLGVSFFGTAFSEPTLIKLASGFEAVTQSRAHNLPTFAATVPFDHIAGTMLKPPHVPAASAAPANQPAAKSPPSKQNRKPHHL